MQIEVVTETIFWRRSTYPFSALHSASSDYRLKKDLQMWKVVANILNTRTRTAYKGGDPLGVRVGRGANRYITQGMGIVSVK
jgi:hypothetical protein